MSDETFMPQSAASTHGHELAGFRRLFYAHVVALVITAMVVVPLLLGTAFIPSWVSLAYCSIIAAVALAFVVAAVRFIRKSSELALSQRVERLAVIVGLSLAQAVFVLPVLLCVYSPNLRL